MRRDNNGGAPALASPQIWVTFEAVKSEIYNRNECGWSAGSDNEKKEKRRRSQIILPEFYQRGETAKKLIG